MVEKTSAFYKGKFIVASKALKLKRDRLVDTAYENAEFFDSLDINDRYPVRPFHGRLKKDGTRGEPYYAYYPKDSEKRNEIEDTRESSEETFAHAVFKQIFSELNKLVFNSYNNSNFNVTAYVKDVKVNQSIYDEKNKRHQIDLLYKLSGTEPYSYFYKWNGQVALKINVSTNVSKLKKEVLLEQGIQILEANIKPEIIKELEDIRKDVKLLSAKELINFLDKDLEELTDNELKNIIDEYLEKMYDETYEKYKNYYITEEWRIFCEPLGEAVIFPKFEERFNMIFGFEQQIKELKNNIDDLNKKALDIQSENDSKHEEFEQQLITEAQKFNSGIKKREKQVVELETNANLLVKQAESRKEEIENSYIDKAEELTQLSQIKAESEYRELKIKHKDRIIQALLNRNWLQRLRNTDVSIPFLSKKNSDQ